MNRWSSLSAILLSSLIGWSSGQPLSAQSVSFRRGDVDTNGKVDLADGITTLEFLFFGVGSLPCRDAGDADDSGTLNVSDTIYVLSFLFQGGSPPPEPFECGIDPTDDDLDCAEYEPSDPALTCDSIGASATRIGPRARLETDGSREPSEPVALANAGAAAQPPEQGAGGQAGAAGGPERVSVLVHLGRGANRGPVRQFARGRGGVVKYEYRILPDVINLRGIPSTAVAALARVPGVVRIEEDAEVHAHMNDSIPLMNALQDQISAAGYTADGEGVRVAILDTGIDSDHAMYSSRIDAAAGRDFVNGDNDPEDDNGHGSHVAGTAVGGSNLTVDFGCVGAEPFPGVAPAATLIGVKVLNAAGSGSFSDVIAGIDYAADQTTSGGRADVINMSLGGGAFSGSCDGDSAAAAANNAVDAGVVVVASAGNEGNSNAMGTPACASKVISVGATYDDDYPNCEFPNLSSFTFCTKVNPVGRCTGTCTDNSPGADDLVCFSNRSDELDVTAPGCVTFSADSSNSPNGIVGFCGTSMAAPHVAGLAALLLSADPSLTPAQVRQAIRDGAIDLGAGGFDTGYGHGRIDALNSLALLSPCDDIDGDGYADAGCGGTDCNDGDPNVNPGATEVCTDGIDNDCDGFADCADSECAGDLVCCPDNDGDGFTDVACGGADCNDGDANVFPGADEVCDNGVDDDCDGDADCDDGDCMADAACSSPPCLPDGSPCANDDECCSGKCRGRPGGKLCR